MADNYYLAGIMTEARPPMSPRFLKAENFNTEKAARRWDETLAWRRENQVDTILEREQHIFSLMKNKYP